MQLLVEETSSTQFPDSADRGLLERSHKVCECNSQTLMVYTCGKGESGLLRCFV